MNLVESQNGNTALHLASMIGRADVVHDLLSVPGIDDHIRNAEGLDPLEVSKTPEIAQIFQGKCSVARDICLVLMQLCTVSRGELNFAFQELLEKWEKETPGTTEELTTFLKQRRIGIVDVNVKSRLSGTTLLHEAVRRKDTAMIELAVRKGADVFVRNKKGKRVLETTKDEKIKALLQQLSNADAAMAANSTSGLPPTFRGFLGKWTNFAGGYKTRWFVLENGILSYYHSQDEEGKQSRGSTNLRFAKIRADNNDKHRFEVIADPPSGSTRVTNASKLYLRGSHPVERARWVQVLQQSVDFFELERSPSRADSIRSSKTGNVDYNGPSLAYTNSNIPAGTMTPFAVPSRTGTPFRGIIAPQAITPGNASNVLNSSSASLKPSIKSRYSSDGKSGFNKTPSIMTRDSRTPSDEPLDGPAQDSSGALRGMPHEDDFTLVSNYLQTQMELSQQLVSSNDGRHASPDVQSALKDALQATSGLLHKYQEIVATREAYLIRRYEHEIQAKRLWEENIRTLAEQHAELEMQLEEAGQENSRKRKAIKEMRETYGMTPGSVTSPGLVASPSAAQVGGGSRQMPSLGEAAALSVPLSAVPATIQARRGDPSATLDAAALKLDQPGLSSPAPVALGASQEEIEDNEDEFFDAIESGNLPGLVIKDEQESTPTANGAKASTAPLAPLDDKDVLVETGVEPYKRLRQVMPIGKDDRPSVSLWSILKNNIGKDLTKISFPVSLNEPTSMLERMAEDMTYASLLDTAVRQNESTLRMAFVAAFACSNYVTTLGRVAKPFNPMLGETFEFINLDGSKYRYQSEQVSHHPPISACIAESLQEDGVTASNKWEYTGCVSAQSKFLGRSFEVRPTGWAHVKLTINGVVEHYSFKKVTTSISGFVTGSPTIDHYGDMNIRCHTTGDECTMTFKPRGWRSSAAHELKGTVTSGKGGALAWEIAGRWSSQMVARRATKATAPGNVLDPDGSVDALLTDPSVAAAASAPEMVLLWKYHEQPLEAFNLTPYAVLLNDLPQGLHDWLPPTDCRLRPDLRLFETGRYEEADVMKRNLEELQRSTRKKREAGQLPPHKPRFFSKVIDADTQADYWQPHRVAAETTPEYWVRRSKHQWDGEKIFGSYTA